MDGVDEWSVCSTYSLLQLHHELTTQRSVAAEIAVVPTQHARVQLNHKDKTLVESLDQLHKDTFHK